MDSPEAPPSLVLERGDTDSVASSQVLRTSNQRAPQRTQIQCAYSNSNEDASRPLSEVWFKGLPESRDVCNPQHRLGTTHAQPSSEREASDDIERRRLKRPRLDTEHGPRDSMANEVASMPTEIMEFAENLMISHLGWVDARSTNIARAILTSPTNFSVVIVEGRKLAEDYARERRAIVEPYRAVVAAFRGQEVAKEKAREFYEDHPKQLMELLVLMDLYNYIPKPRHVESSPQ